MVMTDRGGNAMPLNYTMKGTRIRMDMKVPEGGEMASILDLEKQEVTTLMVQQRMYMVMKLRDGGPKSGPPVGGKADEPTEPPFKATGKSETIAGRKAEQWVSTRDGGLTELWLTEGMGEFMNAPAGPGGPGSRARAAAAWEQFAKGKGMFPLRMLSRDRAGGPVTTKLEVTRIDERRISDDRFVPPPGFQKFEVPAGLPFGPPRTQPR